MKGVKKKQRINGESERQTDNEILRLAKAKKGKSIGRGGSALLPLARRALRHASITNTAYRTRCQPACRTFIRVHTRCARICAPLLAHLHAGVASATRTRKRTAHPLQRHRMASRIKSRGKRIARQHRKKRMRIAPSRMALRMVRCCAYAATARCAHAIMPARRVSLCCLCIAVTRVAKSGVSA
jgi:hypothetical protein